MIKLAVEWGKETFKRQMARAGRLTKGPDNMKRELNAAGDTKSTSTTFNYPKGCKIAAALNELFNQDKR